MRRVAFLAPQLHGVGLGAGGRLSTPGAQRGRLLPQPRCRLTPARAPCPRWPGPGWENTMFFVAYDDGGGFYDHVTPPSEGERSPAAPPYSRHIPAIAQPRRSCG